MNIDYGMVRMVHVGAALTSIVLFFARAPRLVRDPAAPRAAWLRTAPHVVDTVLLGSALWLATQLGWAGTRTWLPAKLVGVVAYIVLGSIALKRGRTLRVRGAAFCGAVAAFAYAASVALTKSSYGIFGP